MVHGAPFDLSRGSGSLSNYVMSAAVSTHPVWVQVCDSSHHTCACGGASIAQLSPQNLDSHQDLRIPRPDSPYPPRTHTPLSLFFPILEMAPPFIHSGAQAQT